MSSYHNADDDYKELRAAHRELVLDFKAATVLNREALRAVEHAMACDFPDEIDFRCERCQHVNETIAKLRAATK